MTRETRIGLFVGLGLVVLFGMIVSELAETPAALPAAESAEREVMIYPHTYVIEQAPVEESGGNQQAVNSNHRVTPRPAPRAAIVQRAPKPITRTYTVRRGDTLIGIATKVYGRRYKREYKRIFQANKRKLAGEGLVMPGQKLVIPPLSVSSRVPARSVDSTHQPWQAKAAAPAQRPRPIAAAITRRGDDRIYQVKQGDTLQEIAYKFYRDDSRRSVMKIYKANEEKLRRLDHLPAGMGLVVPKQ